MAAVLGLQQEFTLARPLFERARRIQLKEGRLNGGESDEAFQVSVKKHKKFFQIISWCLQLSRAIQGVTRNRR